MSLNRNSLLALVAATLAFSLTGCGRHLAPVQVRTVTSTTAETQSVPPQSAFVTISATVVTILPPDTQGLPHQNFVVMADGMRMTVNNDTHYGSEVEDLKVGDKLTIRGVEYHDKNADGIHWTHHADKNGDAGFIKTADGHIYE